MNLKNFFKKRKIFKQKIQICKDLNLCNFTEFIFLNIPLLKS